MPSLLTVSDPIIELNWFEDSFYSLAIRLAINLAVLFIIARLIYYPKARRKDYLFTYFTMGLITFLLCYGLQSIKIGTGMGLGLFAIFSIIRYRTDTIKIKEMTYLFVVIGISVLNALASQLLNISELILINASIIVFTWLLEYVWLTTRDSIKTITYEKIELIVPEKHEELKEDLERRTGLKIERIEIGDVNFMNDTAQIRIFYREST